MENKFLCLTSSPPNELEEVNAPLQNTDISSLPKGALEYFDVESSSENAITDDSGEKGFTLSLPGENAVDPISDMGNNAGIKKRALDDILASFSNHSAEVAQIPLQILKAKKNRSTPRVWRVIGEHFTRKECIERLRFHRWKEPVTNSPRGSGCRVSQCALHVGCTHLLKMRYLSLVSYCHFKIVMKTYKS